jgi:ribonuclease HI
MELIAVIEGFALIDSPGQHVRVHLDSSYVCNPFVKGWLERWKRNGWRRSNGGDVLNRDLWERLIAHVARHEPVEWCKVPGHTGIPLNERAHQLVGAARERAPADPNLHRHSRSTPAGNPTLPLDSGSAQLHATTSHWAESAWFLPKQAANAI